MNSNDSHGKAETTAEHCAYCFDVLIGVLKKEINKSNFPPLPASIPKIDAPLFVTWHKDGDLRGCIGIVYDFFILSKISRDFFKRINRTKPP